MRLWDLLGAAARGDLFGRSLLQCTVGHWGVDETKMASTELRCRCACLVFSLHDMRSAQVCNMGMCEAIHIPSEQELSNQGLRWVGGFRRRIQ